MVEFEKRVTDYYKKEPTIQENIQVVNTFKDKEVQLTVAIDEAQSLTSIANKNDNKPLFRHFRSAINSLLQKCKISFILTSTNTRLAEFNTGRAQIDPSSREAAKNDNLPFTKILFCDELKSTDYLKNIKIFKLTVDPSAQQVKDMSSATTSKQKDYASESVVQPKVLNLFEFVKQREPLNTLFYFGLFGHQ